jgi:hypothetical protein
MKNGDNGNGIGPLFKTLINIRIDPPNRIKLTVKEKKIAIRMHKRKLKKKVHTERKSQRKYINNYINNFLYK